MHVFTMQLNDDLVTHLDNARIKQHVNPPIIPTKRPLSCGKNGGLLEVRYAV